MKKTHIVLLVMIAGAIAVLVSFLETSATYETIAGARAQPGKFVHVAAQLDRSQPMEYDELKDPNYLSFHAIDSTGERMRVVYRKGRIENLEISERVVLEGRFEGDHFECKRVQTKCPSKYKDDLKAAEKTLRGVQPTSQPAAPVNSSSGETKY
ncbi:MAG TPA: cytochrome c maturation protein CcmE [Chitinophagaceae bacterium]|nr:cytochrome c maturation protein CcmE [Chitinophagaceae bacterium]